MSDAAANPMTMMIPMLLMNMKGDDGWWKCLYSLLIVILTSLLSKVTNINGLYDIFNRSRKKKIVYKLTSTVTYKNNLCSDFSLTLPFKAVMNYLYEKITSDLDTRVKYNIFEEALIDSKTPFKIVVFDSENDFYDLTDDIQIMQTFNKRKSTNDEYQYYTYELQVLSKRNNIKDVISFIEQVIKKYDEDQVSQKLHIYMLSHFNIQGLGVCYREAAFNTTKSFDNMFFEQKEMLKNRLDFFHTKGIDRFDRLGIPHTLGMLFHGEPGTGKTSAIKAIARYTNRHIIVIPVKRIINVESLQRIFLEERINLIKIPMHKRLYVFEEIDCSSWKNIVLSRQFKEKESVAETTKTEEIAEALKSVLVESSSKGCKDKKSSIAESSDLTLADILETLDGMLEMPGRFIIMTSNHPERLDPALLRPGRIDLQIGFKKMTRENVRDMYRLWFNEELPMANIKDYVFSQADIGNLFSTYDMPHILKTLTSS